MKQKVSEPMSKREGKRKNVCEEERMCECVYFGARKKETESDPRCAKTSKADVRKSFI